MTLSGWHGNSAGRSGSAPPATARSLPVSDGRGVTAVDVLIVGAGFAGIGMGIQLARRGRESFVIIEQAEDVGGTWRDNRYPGVSCDIPSHLYSFSFRPNPGWSRVFAEGREIHAYLRTCVREEGLEEHLRLNCALSEAEWNDDDAHWLVRTTRAGCPSRRSPRSRTWTGSADAGGIRPAGTRRYPWSAGGSAWSAPVLRRSRSCPGWRPRRARSWSSSVPPRTSCRAATGSTAGKRWSASRPTREPSLRCGTSCSLRLNAASGPGSGGTRTSTCSASGRLTPSPPRSPTRACTAC